MIQIELKFKNNILKTIETDRDEITIGVFAPVILTCFPTLRPCADVVLTVAMVPERVNDDTVIESVKSSTNCGKTTAI